jgi:hypothetical protein
MPFDPDRITPLTIPAELVHKRDASTDDADIVKPTKVGDPMVDKF